ncbi:hypothetical protein, partial [Salmonella sp. s54925]|uniref:hypothetical protein n=1 Tax=Salmonella sp. s54925 TaxID=3159674 RepID=UPI0039806D43
VGCPKSSKPFQCSFATIPSSFAFTDAKTFVCVSRSDETRLLRHFLFKQRWPLTKNLYSTLTFTKSKKTRLYDI